MIVIIRNMSKFSLVFKNLRFFIVLLTIFGSTPVTSSFAAGTDTTIDKVLCNAYKIFNGPLGKTFAIFAIVALGIGFFLGKVSWGTAMAVALGVGAIFGAPALVSTLTGSTGDAELCK